MSLIIYYLFVVKVFKTPCFWEHTVLYKLLSMDTHLIPQITLYFGQKIRQFATILCFNPYTLSSAEKNMQKITHI